MNLRQFFVELNFARAIWESRASPECIRFAKAKKEMLITVMSQLLACLFLVRVEPFPTRGTLIFAIICAP